MERFLLYYSTQKELQVSESNDISKEQFSKVVRQGLEIEIEKCSNSTEKGETFLVWAITRLVDASEDEIRNQIVDGANDMGIDAWIKPDLETEGEGVIQLFQGKYNTSHDESQILQFEKDVDDFLNMKLEQIPRDDLKRLQNMIKDEKLVSELYYLTDKEIEYKSKNPKLNVFGINQIIDKLYTDLVGIPENISQNLKIEKSFEFEDSIVGIVQLAELRKFLEKTKSYIYESNIRKYLQKTKINKELAKTLERNAKDVFYYNNGITMVVKDYKKEDGSLKLLEPQIVNGAQTSQTIFEKLPLISHVQGSLLITIIKADNRTVRNDITRFRNSQNAVKGKDLLSLEAFHTSIRGQLKEIGYYYETQAGAWKYLADKQKEYSGNDIFRNYLGVGHEKMIDASKSIQAMVAGIFQNPTKPYTSIASYMPNGTQYPKVFNASLSQNYRLLLYPYLIKVFGEKLGYGIDEEPEQKRYARLVFVTTYFKILFDYILNTNTTEVLQNPEMLDPIFKNYENNERLLEFTDQAVQYYFDRSSEYYYENNIVTWHNFFSQHAWQPELQTALKSFLNNRKPSLNKLKEHF